MPAKLKKDIWLTNLIVIPIIITLFGVVFQFVIPKFFEKDNEISYSVEAQKFYLDIDTIGDIKLEINDIETNQLICQSARIWNSGGLPIKKLPIKYVFETSSTTFKILMVNHNTNPKYEFGNIILSETDQYSRRFIYDLLNPRDDFTITFLTNETATLNLYAKGESLGIKLIKPDEKNESITFFLIIFVSFIALLFNMMSDRVTKSLINLTKKIIMWNK